MTQILSSYIGGVWQAPRDEGTTLLDAATGAPVARISTKPVDYAAVLGHARNIGGPALRELNFQERAGLLTALAKHLSGLIPDFTELSLRTGATRRDATVDIDGGIGTLFVYGGKGAKELPAGKILLDGEYEQLGKGGTFGLQHISVPRLGAAVQINAFNFPVWGMLEKLAPALLAGAPSVVKPASQTAYLTEMVVRAIIDSQILPEGALQLVCGRPDGLLDQLTGQDSLSVTGSRDTAAALRRHPVIASNSVRFTAEADSLNSSILAEDVKAGDPEFDIFVKGLVTEMTQKAGQKCTAIRRAFVPAGLMDAVQDAVVAQLAKITVGNPADESTRMGALASQRQRTDVRAAVATLMSAARPVFGDPQTVPENFGVDADFEAGAFISPVLLRADDPDREEVHAVEAFGPVSTLLPYEGIEQALDYVARGQGSLVTSIVTGDDDFATRAVLGSAPWHGRLLVVNADNAAENSGHGSAMPHAVHGGPGRAGGGEELAGLRSVQHHLQRTAVQGSPDFLARLGGGEEGA
ncbi:phenylacetic acid degradation bifunctional protein PaaZ [Tomitella biformata]|uniref:phenylacetic acid degradation bifunctional protein PaaZ n=1 Tax=Tomitella biformata TaxID=630403 RepID=UPI000462F7B8|nr:phenylacetic acid degradation bifunctional protein PaaZ [Tomitella biformata]